MAKIINPVRFSDYYKFNSTLLEAAGFLDPTLNVDTRLFIDPMLLEHSQFSAIRCGAYASYKSHFETVIKLLRHSRRKGDVAWRNALRHLRFPEVKWTCLGYGAGSVSGSGSGTDITDRIIRTASEIIDLGVEDPDLFTAMALFEEGFGRDRISDMVTNVILEDLAQLTESVLKNLPVKGKPMTLTLSTGKVLDVCLPVNPFLKKGVNPVILIPTDILRDLPIVLDWSDIESAAAKNLATRHAASEQVARIWQASTLQDKRKMRRVVLSQKEDFETLLDIVRQILPCPYDMDGDPKGEVFWHKVSEWLLAREPFEIQAPPLLDLDGVTSVVKQIISQFQFLIEERRISEELYDTDGNPRWEKAAQRLFFVVADTYCKANNIDITPEAETDNGPVDFKASVGYNGRVLVELKLSKNTKLLPGYTRQLEKYKSAESALRAFYVVIDVSGLGDKRERLLNLMHEAQTRGDPVSKVVFVDGRRRRSASKL